MNSIGVFDMMLFLGYLMIIFGVGVYFSRRQKSQEDYFVGGRNMNWLAVGISLFATSFSSISFLAYPREGAFEDFHLFLTLLFIPFFIVPVLWFVYVPFYNRLGVVSIYEYLERRFSRGLRKLGTLLFAGYAIGWMGSMLYGMGLIMQAVMGLNEPQMMLMLVGIGVFAMVYTMLGGVQAVIWNDVLQTFVLGGGMLIVFYLGLGRIDGGLSTLIQTGMANGKFDMFDVGWDLFERRNVYSAVAFALFMYLPGYTVSQTTAQRYICMNTLGEARRSLLISGLVSTLACFLFFITGTMLYVFYHQPGVGGFPDLFRQDQLLPYFVMSEIPVTGLIGLLLAGLFAAALSTIDSGINSMTAVVVYDWLGGKNTGVKISRIMTCVFGCLVIPAALVSPFIGNFLIEIISKIVGVFLGLLLGIFILGMFVRSATTQGVYTGVACSSIVLVLVWVLTPLPHWWYGAITIGGTVIVGGIASQWFGRDGHGKNEMLFQDVMNENIN